MALGILLHRLPKVAKIIFPCIVIIIVVINVFSPSPTYFANAFSSVQRSDSPKPQPGEIGPSYIRSMSDITNSELLQFILTNGTGDVSEGGRMSIKLVEPFIERLQTEESLEKMREKSMKILENSLMEEERRRIVIEKSIGKKIVYNGNDDRNYLQSEIEPAASLTVKDMERILDKISRLGRKMGEESDNKYFSSLAKRMLENAIVKPPHPHPESVLSSSSVSSSSLSSSSSSSSSSSPSSSSSSSSPPSSQSKIGNPKSEISIKPAGNMGVNSDKSRNTEATKIKKEDKNIIDIHPEAKPQKEVVRRFQKTRTTNPPIAKEAEKESHLTINKGKVSSGNTHYCNETWKAILVGRLAVQTTVRNLSQLQTDNTITDVDAGGHFRPSNCLPLEKIAIIIPFRNREQHLAILLLNLYPVLKRQGVDFTVFVIEENMPTPFNRAMLFNVGFLEAEKISKFDCFIFHDVDLIPINDKNIYQCEPRAPKHFLSGVNKFKYKLPYQTLFGGVVAFTRSQYLKINGASNLYFGWGGEDDDLRRRCINKFQTVFRTAKTVGLYDMIEHDHSAASNKRNPVRGKMISTTTDRQDVEGLNTTQYHVTSINRLPLYTKISVDIDFEKVLKTAPEYASKEMEILKKNFVN